MLIRCLRFALLGAFCCCALVSTAATNPDEKALIALDEDWSKAATAKDVDRVASFYADDAVAYPPNEPIAQGRAAARKVWAAYFAAPGFQISWKTTAAGADHNLGWTSGTYQDSYQNKDGKTVKETGKYVCVWKKSADGKWKAIRDIWNPDK
jgi:ketosteroid isomerase-like protein